MKTSEDWSGCLPLFPPLHETEPVRKTLGPTLRPGGFALIERVLSLYSLSAGSVLLDVGCGTGATAAHLRRSRNLMTFGVDSSAKMLAEAESLNHEVPLVCGCARQLPCRGESVDGVTCECVLSLIPEKQEALREFYRVLRPGGLLILSDIYSRSESGSGENVGFSVSCCSRDSNASGPVKSLLKEIGFDICLCEDHTHLLLELVARLVFECGSLDAFCSEISGAHSCGDVRTMLADSRPGYYLLVARKD